MAITYQLAPMPKWYIADNFGRPLGGGYLLTYYSVDKTALFPVYRDINGSQIWSYVNVPNTTLQGILLDENGSQGPFYWQVDSITNPDFYYIEVRDSNGVLQWSVDNFLPPTGTGGGGGGTTPIQINNIVANNIFWRNIGSANLNTINTLKICPGAHQGFANDSGLTNGKYVGSDIYFLKNIAATSDTIAFRTFSADGTTLPGDVTPVEYLNYTCTNPTASEVLKCVQIPITKNTYNLAGQQAIIKIWARCTSGNTSLTLQWYQFFGSGGSSTPEAVSPIQTLNLTSGWNQYTVSATIPAQPPSVVKGTCGNDALFLRISYPFSAVTNIDFTKPSVYLGTSAPTLEYETYDSIATIIDSPRTGDIKTTLDNSWLSTNNVCPFGWVFMNDGTIGSATSGATARANIDTFPLYNLIWNSISRTWAPLVGATTGSAVGDYNANLPLYLTRALGRVFAGTLNTEVTQSFTYTSINPTSSLTVISSASFVTGAPVTLTTTGSLPSPVTGQAVLTVGVTYYAINVNATTIQLATTLANAVAGSAISFDGTTGSNSSVTVTPYALGQTTGEEIHTLTILEMPGHQHNTLSTGSGSFNENAGAGGGKNSPNNAGSSSVTGGGQAHNNMQPTTYMNVYIKL